VIFSLLHRDFRLALLIRSFYGTERWKEGKDGLVADVACQKTATGVTVVRDIDLSQSLRCYACIQTHP